MKVKLFSLKKSKSPDHFRRFRKKKLKPVRSDLEEKALYFQDHPSLRARKRWYKNHCKLFWFRLRLRKTINRLIALKLPGKILPTVRWVIVDFLRAKPAKFWGIYSYVALPGEGKTLSMVAHIERARMTLGKDLFIATNFNYKYQDMPITHWLDMIKAAKFALNHGQHCMIAVDEIHTTFDASDWKSFPPEMLSLLSFNRKYGMQFICSSQIYDRIPKKVRDISNYTVLCKNTLGLDRHFKNYYFNTLDYESKFSGKRVKADFIRSYVADDYLYSLYDTLAQVDRMTAKAEEERSLKEQAFEILFGGNSDAEEVTD